MVSRGTDKTTAGRKKRKTKPKPKIILVWSDIGHWEHGNPYEVIIEC